MPIKKKHAIAGAVFATTLTVGTALPAHAAAPPAVTTTPVSFACRADPPFESVLFTQNQTITANVPSSVSRGASFSGTGSSAPFVVPTEVNGIANRELRDFTLTMVMSGSATVTGATISGGVNIGPGTPSVSSTSTSVTLVVPGPLAAGSTVTLPRVRINARASNRSGVVRLKVAGTDYTDPGLKVTSVVPLDPDPPIIAPSSCYPSPSPVLSTTTVS